MSIIKVLNQVPAGTKTLDAVLKAGKLNFTASLRPIFYEDLNGNKIVMPFHSAVVNNSNELPIWTVGSRYELVQYRDSFSISELMAGEKGVEFIAADSIGNGAIAFVIMKTPDFIELAPEDKIECFFYIQASHDGSSNITGSLIPVRGGSVATLPFRPFKIRHTKNASEKIGEAKKALSNIRQYWSETAGNYTSFAGLALTEEQVIEYFKMVVDGDSTRADNIRGEIMDVYKGSSITKYPSTNGTLLGAYFAVVEWVDGMMVVKKSRKRTEEEAIIHAKLVGNGASQKAEAYAFGLELLRKFE